MEAKLNIVEILKDKPKDTKLYSPLFGDVYLFYVKNGIINVQHHGGITKFFDNGRYYNYSEAEPLLFPSKEMRDWSKFAWKKGDVLINGRGVICIFIGWTSDDYTKFHGCYSNENNYGDVPNAETAKFDKIDNILACEYIKGIERKLGGKLNLDTLEIEKQPEFKDGDIVVYKCEIEDIPDVIFIFRGKNQHAPFYSYYASLDSNGFLSYKLGAFGIYNRELRLTTKEEKQQLFDALAKRGKAWDAEKKEVVDLKPKSKFEPFDKVLVRNCLDEMWRPSFFACYLPFGREPYQVIDGEWVKLCIPYEGNESLLGTTKDVEG